MSEEEDGRRRREAEEGGYRTKNKNPTRQCGEKWREQMEEATAPLNLWAAALQASCYLLWTRVWVRFRALGIPMVRMDCDRAKEMLAKFVRGWAERRGL